jgi:hypothetical protein
MKTVGILVVSLAAVLLYSAKAEVPFAPRMPAGPIVRSIELSYPGASAAHKKKILASFSNLVGHPFSERVLDGDMRGLYNEGGIGGCKVFGAPLADGVKVAISVYLVFRSESQTSPAGKEK